MSKETEKILETEVSKETEIASETEAVSDEYGKSNAEATGEVALDTLTGGYETLRNAEEITDYTYEDVRDLMGCDGQVYKIDGIWHSYCWQNGDVILTLTFKVKDDGTERCYSNMISGIET